MTEPAIYRPSVDDASAYRDAMRRAEEASGMAPDGTFIVSEETPDEQELAGAVPVQASDQPLTPEPAQNLDEDVADTSEQQQVAPAVEPTADDLKAQLAAAEARIEEQKTMIGRQSTEVSETRQAIADLKAQIAAVQALQATPVAPATIQITQELIDTNPAAAVQAAFAQRNEQALQIAFEAWKDPISGDPFAAAAWLNDRKLEQQQAAFDAKLAETQKQFETVAAPIAQNEEHRQWALAFEKARATQPDLIDNAERLLTEVASQYGAFLPILSTGDADAKAEALLALYALDKMGNPQAVQAQLEEAAQEAATEAAAARAAASVVTGQSTAGQPSEQKTPEELEQERYFARQQSKPSLSRGWTGRS